MFFLTYFTFPEPSKIQLETLKQRSFKIEGGGEETGKRLQQFSIFSGSPLGVGQENKSACFLRENYDRQRQWRKILKQKGKGGMPNKNVLFYIVAKLSGHFYL